MNMLALLSLGRTHKKEAINFWLNHCFVQNKGQFFL